MDVLHVVLVVLVAVAIWAVVELALTIRRARSSVEEVARSANEAIAQVQPIISKADGMVDDLEPAVKQVQPLIERANTAVDVATVDLASLNDILKVHPFGNASGCGTTPGIGSILFLSPEILGIESISPSV